MFCLSRYKCTHIYVTLRRGVDVLMEIGPYMLFPLLVTSVNAGIRFGLFLKVDGHLSEIKLERPAVQVQFMPSVQTQ